MTSVQSRARRAFIWVVLIPIAFAVLSFWAAGRYHNSIAWVSHTKDVLAAVQDLRVTITEAESNQRGYLFTGEKLFRLKYLAATAQLPEKLALLRQLTADNPRQQTNCRLLSAAIHSRLQIMAHVLALRSAGHLSQIQAAQAMNQAVALMDQIRQISSAIIAEEDHLLAERSRKQRRTEIELGVSFTLGISISIFLLFGAYRLIRQYAAKRDRAEAEIRTLNAELEARVQERTAELEEANRQLSRSNRDLTEFAYVASHDLQEPLRTLGSYAGLLARRYKGKLDEQADKYIYYLVEGAKRMQNLIQDLLAYSRAGTEALRYELVDMADVLERAKENLKVAISERYAVIGNDALLQLEADDGRLTQVLQNLIATALKFSKPGETPRVDIGAIRQEREWIFTVKDDGIGFEPEYAEKIFVIFQRLHQVGAYAGTGMGFAICKRIIEAHGGRIWAESEPGVGSTFFFTVPAQRGAKMSNNEGENPINSDKKAGTSEKADSHFAYRR